MSSSNFNFNSADSDSNFNSDSDSDSDSKIKPKSNFESADYDSDDSDSEARITAYLLGEISFEEAQIIERKLSQDSQLQQLTARLQETIKLIKHASSSSDSQADRELKSLRFSSKRRADLIHILSNSSRSDRPIHQHISWNLPVALAAILMIAMAYLAFLKLQIPIEISEAFDDELQDYLQNDSNDLNDSNISKPDSNLDFYNFLSPEKLSQKKADLASSTSSSSLGRKNEFFSRGINISKSNESLSDDGIFSGLTMSDLPSLKIDSLATNGDREDELLRERSPFARSVLRESLIENRAKQRFQSRSSSAFPLEVETSEQALSTFSLNVSDVSFGLAEAALNAGQIPEKASIRPEEFFNALSYHDIPFRSESPVSVLTERARFPFGHQQELLRISIRTSSFGRSSKRALNIVVLLDNSGSMERHDRQAIVRLTLESLFDHLEKNDRISLITFARKPRLHAEGLTPKAARKSIDDLLKIIPEGGTHLESALQAGYECARKHYRAKGQNRILLLTDGAANLGNTDAESLRQIVISHRKQGIALDCFGIGWEGYDDHQLENLSRNGDGHYAFLNDLSQIHGDFQRHLTGAFSVSAKDVKVQIRFNPDRVSRYRQIGYAKHQLDESHFRDPQIDAAEMADEEAGTALYILQIHPDGKGDIGELALRFQNPETGNFHEQSWNLTYSRKGIAFEDASPETQLALAAALFAERLADIPYSRSVSFQSIEEIVKRVSPLRPLDPSLARLRKMILQTRMITGQ